MLDRTKNRDDTIVSPGLPFRAVDECVLAPRGGVEGGVSRSCSRMMLVLLAYCLLTGTAWGQPRDAQTPARKLAEQYAQDYRRLTEIEQERQVTNRAAMDAPAASGGAGGPVEMGALLALRNLSPAQRRLVASMVVENVRGPVQRMVDVLADSRRRVDPIVNHWIDVRTARNQAELDKAELIAGKAVAGKLASLVSLDNRWFWLSTVIVVGVMVAASWHERRHEYRRRLLGAKARAMGVANWLRYLLFVLIAITLVTFFLGDRIFHWLTHASGGAATPSLADLEAQVEKQSQTLKDAQAAFVLASGAPEQPPSDDPERQLAYLWQRLQYEARQSLVSLQVQQELTKALRADEEQLKLLVAEAAQNQAEIDNYQRSKRWIRAAMGGTLLSLIGVTALVFLRGVRRRRMITQETCPMCLAVGTLNPVTDGVHAGNMVRCGNLMSEVDDDKCDFTFLSVYRDMSKLCFPTLGHPSSGKTHWLAMTYRELNQRSLPGVQLDKVRSDSSEEMDRIVDDLINARLSTTATQVDRLPRPLLFNFSDHDRYGKSNGLISLFDYSGEVLQRMTLNDPQRRRALDADGYLFFLDPTQRSEDQVKELLDFREDVRVLRNVKSGQALRAPVALCVSKIDLLINQDYADAGDNGPVQRFYRELEEIDPTGVGMSVEIMERRSEAIARLRDTIWPGWQVEKQIHELFGGRCLFFPLTPVGLTELGVEDLGQRTIQPFGILDPLIWLLHMNGYKVLS